MNEFFNTAAFVNPNNQTLGTYGNASRGLIYGPAYANTDASLLKDFILPVSFKLQFRLESFNTFNQVNFANPNSYAMQALGLVRFNRQWREPAGNFRLH